MHDFNNFTALKTSCHIRLICGYNKQESGFIELAQCIQDTGKNLELCQRGGWIRLPLAHHGPINDSITIKKYGTTHAAHTGDSLTALSHLVPTICNLG